MNLFGKTLIKGKYCTKSGHHHHYEVLQLLALLHLCSWQHLVASVPGVPLVSVDVTPPPVIIGGLIRMLKCLV